MWKVYIEFDYSKVCLGGEMQLTEMEVVSNSTIALHVGDKGSAPDTGFAGSSP